MADEATLPTADEIVALPRWARVAFAARCARRVLPLFREAAWAVRMAERSAAVAAEPTDPILASYIVADTRAGAAFDAAFQAALAARGFADISAYSAAQAAAKAASDAIPAMRHDFHLALEAVRSEEWTDATTVPPWVFGPMWPDGVPDGWPEADPEERLVVTVAAPPEAPAAEVADFRNRLYQALNKLVVASGGAGLTIDTTRRDVPIVVPAGTGV